MSLAVEFESASPVVCATAACGCAKVDSSATAAATELTPRGSEFFFGRAAIQWLNRPTEKKFRPLSRQRAGFTLVEALVAVSIVAVAGSVLLLAVESALQTTWDAVDKTIADGIAQQVLDEVTTKRYMAEGAGATDALSTLGASSTEKAGKGRERYNDTDDYRGFLAMPVEGIHGERLGSGNDEGRARHPAFQVPQSHLSKWRQRIDVYYVHPDNHSVRLTSSTSHYRAVEVHIEHVESDGTVRPLASRKRVYAYLPPPN